MILMTVGTQLPFDRLVKSMDMIAPELGEKVFAQIGVGKYLPKNFEYCRLVTPRELDEKFESADRIVSHAGTGSLLTARRYNKPIILFPRRASLGEHRNEHQLATCKHLELVDRVSIAYTEDELYALLRTPNSLRSEQDKLPRPSPSSVLGRSISQYIKDLSPPNNTRR